MKVHELKSKRLIYELSKEFITPYSIGITMKEMLVINTDEN
jgi:hypothetical protein